MSRGQTLVEFAVAWPVALLLVFGCVQLGIWSAESQAAREAALAGARQGTVVGTSPGQAAAVAVAALRPWLVGTAPGPWCPGDPRPPAVWVCAWQAGGGILEVSVGGRVPSLLPLLPGGGLPVRADVRVRQEAFG